MLKSFIRVFAVESRDRFTCRVHWPVLRVDMRALVDSSRCFLTSAFLHRLTGFIPRPNYIRTFQAAHNPEAGNRQRHPNRF